MKSVIKKRDLLKSNGVKLAPIGSHIDDVYVNVNCPKISKFPKTKSNVKGDGNEKE